MNSQDNDTNEKDVKLGKADISKALSVIPPATSLKGKGKKISEKRIRISYDSSLEKGEAKISKKLAQDLGIQKELELVIAGKKKFVMKAVIDEGIKDDNKVFANPDEMKDEGIADNSIATVRAVSV
ncbi:MAG: hypothetical protein ACP5I6_04165 [Caldisphaera sp.]|jgi:hypothetical protein|nr:hypothetical protein [Caldisphaera sp.]PMP61124.1 MAG: hypothetical protein C0201_00270 [Caldisphaera sp.]